MMIDYDHRSGDQPCIALIESVCEDVKIATLHCTGVKYAYMSWCGEILLTMYLKPGIVLNIRTTPQQLSTTMVINAFKGELIRKFW